MKRQSDSQKSRPSWNRSNDIRPTESSHTPSRTPLDRSVFVGDEVSQPQPSPANSEDLGATGGLNHVNTHDTGIGLDDFKLDDIFLDQFEPGVQSKLKLITAAHDNAKKYLDITVKALSNQKQYLKYMSEQNRDYQCKLENLEAELKREQTLKERAEKDITMWKTECQKAESTFNKVKSRKRQIQVSLAQMYDKYDVLMSENQSLRRLVANLSSSGEETKNACLPARKPKQAVPRVSLTEARSETMFRLPPIAKSSQSRGNGRSRRAGQSTLPPIEQESRRQVDSDHPDTRSHGAPWNKNSFKNNSSKNINISSERPSYRKL